MYSSSEHSGVTQRPPASAFMLVDSLDRYGVGWPATDNGVTTSSDWKLNFQTPVLNGYLTRLALTQLSFQYNLPTIITGYNDTIRVTATGGGGTQNVVIAQGFYLPEDLADAIETALQGAYPTQNFTCTFENYVFKIVNGAGNDFWLITPANPNVIAAGTTNLLARTYITLGFLGRYGNLTPATTLTGGVPTMIATRFIDICSYYLTKYQRVKDTSTLINQPRADMIYRLYPVPPNQRVNLDLNNSVGSTPFSITVDPNTPKHASWNVGEAISNFDIQVRDEFGDLLPWSAQYGCEYQFTFLASES